MASAAAGAVVAAAILAAAGQDGREIGWCPNPGPQVRFLSCPADEVLYGGAAGGGKSDALLVALLRQVSLPGYVGLYLRREYPAMQEAIARAGELYPLVGGCWRAADKTWGFPSGARVLFRHLQREETVQQFKSQAFAVVAWDELTTFTEYQYTYLRSRVRTTAPGVRCQVLAATNPDGPGLAWVRARFIEGRKPGLIYRAQQDNGLTRTQAFVPALLADNPHLGADYEAALMSLGSADRAALLAGDWYAYDGQVFRLEPGRNLVSSSEAATHWGGAEPPAWWPRYRVMDWGYRRPYCVLWVAVDPQGRGWVYREIYGATGPNEGAQHDPAHVGRLIASVEHEHGELVTSWAGPDLWFQGRGDYGQSRPLAEEFSDAGCYWTGPWEAGPGSRRAKRQRVAAMLEGLNGNREGLPGIVIVGDRCPGLARTLPALQYSRTDPEDVDSNGEDHAYDALAGWALMRSFSGEAPSEREPRRRASASDWQVR